MSDLMREEFEAWLLDIHGLESEWQEARNCFKDFPAHLAYQAWQASRECLVIELPIIQECCSDGGESSKWMAPEDVIKSIRAAGVKTK